MAQSMLTKFVVTTRVAKNSVFPRILWSMKCAVLMCGMCVIYFRVCACASMCAHLGVCVGVCASAAILLFE